MAHPHEDHPSPGRSPPPDGHVPTPAAGSGIETPENVVAGLISEGSYTLFSEKTSTSPNDAVESLAGDFDFLYHFRRANPSAPSLVGLEREASTLKLLITQISMFEGHDSSPSPFFQQADTATLVSVLNSDDGLSEAIQSLLQLLSSSERKLGQGENIVSALRKIVYHVCYKPSIPETELQDPAGVARAAECVRRAWDAPFVGTADLRILHSLRLAFEKVLGDTTTAYANNVSMLQSSGTGKTRTADKLAELVFAFPFVLREDGRAAEFPEADSSIRELMKLSFRESTSRFRALFKLLFDCATCWLQSQQWAQSAQPSAYLEKVNAWKIFLKCQRKAIYASVEHGVKEMEQEIPALKEKMKKLKEGDPQNTLLQLQKQLLTLEEQWIDQGSKAASKSLAKLRAELNRTDTTHAPRTNGNIAVPAIFKTQLSPDQRALAQRAADDALQRWKSNEWPKHVGPVTIDNLSPLKTKLTVLVYFDEAHVLTQPEPPNKDQPNEQPRRSRYDYLLSVLNDMSPNILGLFLSTSSHIRQLAPPPVLAASARLAESKFLQAPLTELPFDVQTAAEISRLPHLLKDISSLQFMAKFGRPLFWSLFLGYADLDDVEKEQRELDILGLAKAKLVNSRLHPDGDWKHYLKNALIAILDVRLCFEYEPRKSTTDGTEAELVAHYLRIAYSVPLNREYFYSGYSSEPFLAEAAAHHMRDWMWARPGAETLSFSKVWNPIDTLTHLMANGLLDRGERGEVVARYICVRAYDEGMRIAEGRTHGWLFSSGCSVENFFTALFGDELAEKILASKPDNVSGSVASDFKTSFNEHAVLRFTHFVRLGDESGITTRGLAAAMIRCAAFICRRGQKSIDLILPVLLDSRKPVTPDNMTAILIQVKLRASPGTPAEYDFTAEDLKLFLDSDTTDELRQRPYCTLLMELGVKLKSTSQTTQPQAPSGSQPTATSAKPTVRAPAKSAPMAQTGSRAPPPTPSKMEVVAAPPRQSARAAAAKPSVHPRFNIRAFGCSHTIYKIFKPEDKQTISGILLANKTWLEEHPRSEMIDCVDGLLPTWKAKNAYGWVDDKPMTDYERADETEEGVRVEKYAD